VSKGIAGLLVGGALMLLMLVSGCGGGEDTTTITRAQFIKQGKGICEVQGDKKEATVAAAVAGFDPAEELKEAEKKQLILEIIPFYEKATAEIKDLGAPEGDENKIEAITQAREKAAREIRANLDLAIRSLKPFEKANSLSADYGLECPI
jgi:hypothetical protein